MMKVRVRFARNVLGRRAGTVDWVEATPIVETLVRIGHLKWLDRPAAEEDWMASDVAEVEDNDVATLPSGETIETDELVDRLADDDEVWETDGGRS